MIETSDTENHKINGIIQNACRTCALFFDENHVLVPIFQQIKINRDFQIINELISLDMKVEKDDGLPQKICLVCLKQLSKIHKFRELCKRSEIALKAYLSEHQEKNVKIEDCDEYNDNDLPYAAVEFDGFDEDIEIKNYPANEEDNIHENQMIGTENDSDDDGFIKLNLLTANENKIAQKVTIDSIEIDPIFTDAENLHRMHSEYDKQIEILETEESEEFLSSFPLSSSTFPTSIVQCEKCHKYSFASRSKHDAQICVHLRKTDKYWDADKSEFCCFYCDQKFESHKSIHHHITDIHPIDEPFLCLVCNKTFPNAKKRNGHLRYHYENAAQKTSTSCSSIVRKTRTKNSSNTTSVNTTAVNICEKEGGENSHKSSADNQQQQQQQQQQEFTITEDTSNGFNYSENNLSSVEDVDEEKLDDDDVQNSEISSCLIVQCEKCHKYSFASRLKHDSQICVHLRKTETNSTVDQSEFCCFYCDEKFDSENAVQQHITDIHRIDEPFMCVVCHKTFPNAKKRNGHARYHDISKIKAVKKKEHEKLEKSDAPQQCKICSKIYVNSIRLKEHQRKVHADGEYECELCGKQFDNAARYRFHLRAHEDKNPRYKCRYCGKTFLRSPNLREHERKHTGTKPYQCKHCNKRFSYGSSYLSHVKTHSGLRPFVCDECGRAFASNTSLTDHKRIHSDGEQFQCEHCGKRFKLVSTLRSHRVIHYENEQKKIPKIENFYKCPICPKEFSLPSIFEQHMKAHNDGLEYWCEKCNNAYEKAEQLEAHMKRTHLKKRIYTCKYCPKQFPDSNSRETHMVVHENDQFKCSFCDKTFKTLKYVKNHEVVHNGRRRRSCPICSRIVRTSSFSKHLRRHTPEDHKLANERILAENANLLKSIKADDNTTFGDSE